MLAILVTWTGEHRGGRARPGPAARAGHAGRRHGRRRSPTRRSTGSPIIRAVRARRGDPVDVRRRPERRRRSTRRWRRCANATSPFSLVQFRGLGGAMARVGSDATAFAHRDQAYFLAIIAVWLDPTEDAADARRLDRVALAGSPPRRRRRLRQLPGERGRGAHPRRLPGAPPTRASPRSSAQYDPENLFRFNQNVPPRRGPARRRLDRGFPTGPRWRKARRGGGAPGCLFVSRLTSGTTRRSMKEGMALAIPFPSFGRRNHMI